MDRFYVLNYHFEEVIREFLDQKLAEEEIKTNFSNSILREDVMALLEAEKHCKVVYFPLSDRNNGFHIMDIPLSNGEKYHFVFINTSQTMEKQNFTAAHELGHIWNIDEYVLAKLRVEPSPEMREAIINRFAAMLLMPENLFCRVVDEKLAEINVIDGTSTMADALKVVVYLMNHFFAPKKAVVLRLCELGRISQEGAKDLLGYGDLDKDIVEAFVKKVIRDNGYTRLEQTSEKKWIEGLGELLEQVEEGKLVPQAKTNYIRELFELEKLPNNLGETGSILLKAQEGNDSE